MRHLSLRRHLSMRSQLGVPSYRDSTDTLYSAQEGRPCRRNSRGFGHRVIEFLIARASPLLLSSSTCFR